MFKNLSEISATLTFLHNRVKYLFLNNYHQENVFEDCFTMQGQESTGIYILI